MVIFGVEHNPRYPDAEPVPYTVLVNPVLDAAGRRDGGGLGRVPERARACADWCRATGSCATRATTSTGNRIDRTVSGFHARVVQHECDHLAGILYPMRIRDLRNFGFTEELFPGRGRCRRTD